MNNEYSLAPEEEEIETNLKDSLLDSKSQSKMVTALRWITVLPAAICAYFAVQLLVIMANATMAEGHADWYLQLINSFAGAYGFVFVGSHTAPKQQFTVAVVLASLLAIFMIGLLVVAYLIKTTDPYWWLVLASGVSFIALVAAVLHLKENKCQLK